MEPLEATLVDELLRDFSGDAVPPTPSSLRRHRVPGAPRPETAFVEEEDLEWLSNKDAFPSLDTFAISGPRKPSPPPAPKRPSPVSILDGGGCLDTAAPPFLPRAPGRARSEGRRRRRRALPVFRPVGSPSRQEKRRCWHCQAEETPQWRAGPGGPRTLCNACGVRYKSGRLVPEYRPANSPTFSGYLHSNSHRKIIEMRRRKQGLVPTVAAAKPATKKTQPKKKKNREKQEGGPLI